MPAQPETRESPSDTQPETRTLYDTPEHQARVARQEQAVADARRLTERLRELNEDACRRIDDRLRRLGA